MDANDTLDGEVSLVSECTSKVVRADLVSGNERLGNEITGPLTKQIGLLIVRQTTPPTRVRTTHVFDDD